MTRAKEIDWWKPRVATIDGYEAALQTMQRLAHPRRTDRN
jgi:hypothetical protein